MPSMTWASRSTSRHPMPPAADPGQHHRQSTEEEAEEAAEAALSTVDSSSAARPTRCACTCAKWARSKLLTREGEIEIAKRIEGGHCSGHDAGHLSATDDHRPHPGHGRQDPRRRIPDFEVVDGFVAEDGCRRLCGEEDFDEFDEEDDDDGNGGSKALTKKLEEPRLPPWSSST